MKHLLPLKKHATQFLCVSFYLQADIKRYSPAFEDVTAHTQTYFKTELSLISIRLIILTDLEVAQLVAFLIRRHHPQPVSQVVLLQVLLCEVLKIPAEHGAVSINTKTLKRTLIINISLLMYRISPFRELLLCCDADFVLLTHNLHYISQVACFAINLHLLFQKAFLLVIKQHEH